MTLDTVVTTSRVQNLTAIFSLHILISIGESSQHTTEYIADFSTVLESTSVTFSTGKSYQKKR